MGVERVAGTEGLHRDIFGLCALERQAGPGRGCAEHASLGPAGLGALRIQLLVPLLHPVLQPLGRLPASLSQQCTNPAGCELVSPSESSGSTTRRWAAAKEPQEKVAAGKEASSPAQLALGMRQSKGSITWRHVPVDGARTSQGRRTSQSYPSPFSDGQPRSPTDRSALRRV